MDPQARHHNLKLEKEDKEMKPQTPRESLAEFFLHYGLRRHFIEAATDKFLALTGTTEDGIKWRMGAYREDGDLPENPFTPKFTPTKDTSRREIGFDVGCKKMREAGYHQLLEG